MNTNIHTPVTTSSKCLLVTEGYKIIFNLKSLETTKQYMDLIVKFQLDPNLAFVAVKSQPALISITDLKRLVTYFEEHIAQLQENPNRESYTFLTCDLGFQVQALSGEVRSPHEGEFSIRFMVNVGQNNAEASRTYVGGESVVTLENIQSFTSSLQEL
ncbi:MAG: hypothetical protein KME21_01880 [Desmonostoc vinosum HA7617-LM4]|jgi:hypothetical protein|nr:hypothetical protein [Desmonostoc vinosum HA7617-LM4]